jgi:hypothetical protein
MTEPKPVSSASDESLMNFFSCYFQEDWNLEANSPDEIVAGFARTAEPHEVQALSAAIANLSCQFASEKELEKRLFDYFGCYYCPSADGRSTRAWLLHVADLLLKVSSR